MKKIRVSVIIPVRTITPYLKEAVYHLRRQDPKVFEILVITDKKENYPGVMVIPSGDPGPAYKRNLAAAKARGEILAFLDDDSYPGKNWLCAALKVFSGLKDIAAACGPTLTPPADNERQKASGWVWSSWLGSWAAGLHRNRLMARREVDDFPSVNLFVRKKDFESVGGFDVYHWPGEDTKLCLDLVGRGKKIIYDPQIIVYHHRREVFLPHLKQISRYALRRGLFARKFPKTSLRFGYLLPSFFAYGLVFGSVLCFIFPLIRSIFIVAVAAYALAIFITFGEVLLKEKNYKIALLAVLAIPLTHLVYGFLFPAGFLRKDLGVVPKKIDKKKKVYVEG